jgi:hypothetical protein
MSGPWWKLVVALGMAAAIVINARPAAAQSVIDVSSRQFEAVDENTFYLTYSTFGSEDIGPSVGAFAASLPGILGTDSQIDGAVLLAGPSLDHHLEATAAGLWFRKKLPLPGTTLFLAADAADVRLGSAQALAIGAEGWRARISAAIRHDMVLTKSSRLSAAVEIEQRLTTGEAFGASAIDERINVLHARLVYSAAQGDTVRYRLETRVSKGLDVLGSTGNDNPLGSRPGANAVFFKASITASGTVPLAAQLDLTNAVHAQWADRALPASQQCFYGSNRFSRGFDVSFIGGDRCAAAMHEITFNAPIAHRLGLTFLKPYVALDYGVVQNLTPTSSSSSERWASMSVGLRFATSELISDAYVSRILQYPAGRYSQPTTRAWIRSAIRF